MKVADKKKNKETSGWPRRFFSLLAKRYHTITPLEHAIFLTTAVMLALIFLILNSGGLAPAGFNNRDSGLFSAKVKEKNLQYNVFGDHFVNDLYIDWHKTNFYYDQVTTAFTFLPDYDWLTRGACADRFCGLTAADWNFPEIEQENDFAGITEEYCLSGRCLRHENLNLYYQGKKIDLPTEVRSVELRNITIYPLNSDWLVGFVFYNNGQEQGRAYRFDGRNFSNLDEKNTISLISRDGFEGARFGFGGDEDNFLVLYGGYDLLGYQVVRGLLFDVSNFLGLRVADGGFAPSIFKHEIDGEVLWHICSRTAGKPKLIKLWQNSSGNIKGSLSLTEPLLKEKEGAESAWCRPGDVSGELELIVAKRSAYEWRTFRDKGFRQQDGYQITTKNLFKESGEVLKVNFNDLKACDDQICDQVNLFQSLSFLISGNGADFWSATLGKEVVFPASSTGIYWTIKADSHSEKAHYSPWVDGLLSISYVWN